SLRLDDSFVDLGPPLCHPLPAIALLRERPRRATVLRPRGLVLEQRDDTLGQRLGIARRYESAGLRFHHAAIAGDVRGDNRRRAREAAREDHPEALAAERRRDEGLRPKQLLRQLVLGEEAADVDSLVGDAQPREEQTDGKRVGADHAQPRPGASPDLRPRTKQELEPLARLMAIDE